MNSKEFYTLCNYLYGITQIPLFLINKDQEVVLTIPKHLEDIKSMSDRNDFFNLKDSVSIQTDGEFFCYSIIKISMDQQDYALFLGPIFLNKLSLSAFLEFAKTSKELSHLTYDELQMLHPFIPHSTIPYLCDTITLIYYLLCNKTLSTQEILQDQLDDSIGAKIPITTWETLVDRRETANFHTPYSIEQRQMQIIKTGDLDGLNSFFHDPNIGTPGVLSKNPLRHEKNLFISGITLMTRAAMDGGLNEETAYSMSDSFIQVVEDCNSIKDVHILRDRALYEFTYQVSLSKERPNYSPSILRALHYIHNHLHEDLTLNDLSKAAHLSTGQLSRKFKNEVGYSFVDYVKKERVYAAKNLLTYSDYSYSEISNYLSFSSQSYFISVFKKEVGMTPSLYRRKYQRVDY